MITYFVLSVIVAFIYALIGFFIYCEAPPSISIPVFVFTNPVSTTAIYLWALHELGFLSINYNQAVYNAALFGDVAKR